MEYTHDSAVWAIGHQSLKGWDIQSSEGREGLWINVHTCYNQLSPMCCVWNKSFQARCKVISLLRVVISVVIGDLGEHDVKQTRLLTWKDTDQACLQQEILICWRVYLSITEVSAKPRSSTVLILMILKFRTVPFVHNSRILDHKTSWSGLSLPRKWQIVLRLAGYSWWRFDLHPESQPCRHECAQVSFSTHPIVRGWKPGRSSDRDQAHTRFEGGTH